MYAAAELNIRTESDDEDLFTSDDSYLLNPNENFFVDPSMFKKDVNLIFNNVRRDLKSTSNIGEEVKNRLGRKIQEAQNAHNCLEKKVRKLFLDHLILAKKDYEKKEGRNIEHIRSRYANHLARICEETEKLFSPIQPIIKLICSYDGKLKSKYRMFLGGSIVLLALTAVGIAALGCLFSGIVTFPIAASAITVSGLVLISIVSTCIFFLNYRKYKSLREHYESTKHLIKAEITGLWRTVLTWLEGRITNEEFSISLKKEYQEKLSLVDVFNSLDKIEIEIEAIQLGA